MPLAADRRRHGARPGQAKTLVRPTTQKNRIPDEEQPKNVYFFFAEMCCSGPRSCRGVMLAKHPRPESESRPTKWITSHLRGHASSDNTYIIHVHYIHTRTSAKRQEPGTQYVGRLLGPKAAAGITQRTCSSTATLDPLKDCPAIHEVAAPRASEPGRRQLGRQAVAVVAGTPDADAGGQSSPLLRVLRRRWTGPVAGLIFSRVASLPVPTPVVGTWGRASCRDSKPISPGGEK